MENSSVR